jgi:hypothetical protein
MGMPFSTQPLATLAKLQTFVPSSMAMMSTVSITNNPSPNCQFFIYF